VVAIGHLERTGTASVDFEYHSGGLTVPSAQIHRIVNKPYCLYSYRILRSAAAVALLSASVGLCQSNRTDALPDQESKHLFWVMQIFATFRENVCQLGVQIGVDVAANILKEFYPDILHRTFTRVLAQEVVM
jgi:hypothetical protein